MSTFFAAAVIAAAALSQTGQTQPPRVNPTAKAIAEFNKALDRYVQLHRDAERTLPPLPDNATPQQIDQRQRELGRLIQQKRPTAKANDVFVREARPVLRRLLYSVLKGSTGAKLRQTIGEEHPPGEAVKLQVNARYPDTIPLSTVPPQVLQVLPALPDELEYRFIADTLILLDRQAHIIVDYLTGAVPH